MSNTRTIKTVLISKGSKRGYSYSVYRVVECEVGQRGYLTERGVKVIWESEWLYRPITKTGRGKGPEAKRQAEHIRKSNLRNILSLPADSEV